MFFYCLWLFSNGWNVIVIILLVKYRETVERYHFLLDGFSALIVASDSLSNGQETLTIILLVMHTKTVKPITSMLLLNDFFCNCSLLSSKGKMILQSSTLN